MHLFLTYTILGLVTGAVYGIAASGLVLTYTTSGIFNFAQGEFVLLGAYVTYLASAHGIPVWIGMFAAPFLVGSLGFVLEALIIRRFYAAPIVAMQRPCTMRCSVELRRRMTYSPSRPTICA